MFLKTRTGEMVNEKAFEGHEDELYQLQKWNKEVHGHIEWHEDGTPVFYIKTRTGEMVDEKAFEGHEDELYELQKWNQEQHERYGPGTIRGLLVAATVWGVFILFVLSIGFFTWEVIKVFFFGESWRTLFR